jgi:glycosyltransferase involved in cell wall biosynthesis
VPPAATVSMRILQTATAYYPSVGGAQLHWFTIARLLCDRGHAVLAASQWTDQRHHYLLDSTLLAPWGDDRYEVEGIPVFRYQPSAVARCWMAPLLPFCYAVPEVAYPLLSRYFARKFRRLPGRPDLVHNIRIGREHFSWASLAEARRHGVPFCITPNYSPRMQSRAGRWVMRHFFRLLRRAEGVFVFTGSERDEMVRLGVERGRICQIGVGPLLADHWDAEGFKRAHGIRRHMVLFLGQKLSYKGFDALIAAAPMVWRVHPETSFVFMGPHYGRSRETIIQLRDSRVVDIPRVEVFDPLKASALAAADVFALPSRQEGIGGVYIEAWAMRKPVIGCRIPFLTIEDGVDGFLVEQEAGAIADRINRLLGHPDEARRMGEHGYRKVQTEYSWDHIVSRVEAFYTGLTVRMVS